MKSEKLKTNAKFKADGFDVVIKSIDDLTFDFEPGFIYIYQNGNPEPLNKIPVDSYRMWYIYLSGNDVRFVDAPGTPIDRTAKNVFGWMVEDLTFSIGNPSGDSQKYIGIGSGDIRDNMKFYEINYNMHNASGNPPILNFITVGITSLDAAHPDVYVFPLVQSNFSDRVFKSDGTLNISSCGDTLPASVCGAEI